MEAADKINYLVIILKPKDDKINQPGKIVVESAPLILCNTTHTMIKTRSNITTNSGYHETQVVSKTCS